MRYIQIFMISFLILVFSASGVSAAADWKTFKTDHFTVFYKPGFEKPARQVLEILEFYRPQLEQLTGNEVKGLPVVIEDTGYTNGYANPTYQNIHLYITPPATGTELGSAENWWSLAAPHEYIHMLSLQKTAGVIGFFKAIFGNVFLPNADAPGWVVEGITVYGESALSPYQGRLNDGYYDAYLGACVRDNYFPSITQATFSPFRYPFGGRYLFGGEFLGFLAKTYGAEKFARFFKANGASALNLLGIDQVLPFSGIDLAAQSVYGKSFPALWKEWRAAVRERFKDFAMEGEQLTRDGWYIYDIKYDNQSLYYQRRRAVDTGPGYHYSTELIRYDTQNKTREKVLATTSSFSLPLRIHQNKLYYGVTEIKPGYSNISDATYGEYAVLHEKDLGTGADRVILTGEIRAYDILEDGTILFAKDRKGDFGSELYSLEPGAQGPKPLFITGYLIQEIAATNGRIAVAAQPEWHNANIYLLDMERQWLTPVLDSPYQKADLSFQGDKLFYVSNIQNQYRTYCLDFSNGMRYRLTTNGYSLSPAYDQENNQLYYIGLTSKGNEIHRKYADFEEYPAPANPAGPGEPVEPEISGMPDTPAAPGTHLDPATLKIPMEEGTYGDNFKTLLPVYQKLELILNDQGAVDEYHLEMAGSSAIGDLRYDNNFSYNTFTGDWINKLGLNAYFWAPLEIRSELYNASDDSTGFGTSLGFPFIRKYSPGLNHLWGEIIWFQQRSGPMSMSVTNPYALFSFGFPETRIAVNLDARFYEVDFLPSFHESSTFFSAGATISRFLLDGTLTVNWGLDGYKNDTTTSFNNSQIMELKYSRNIWAIQQGLWNPCIFVDKLWGSVYQSRVSVENNLPQTSFGLRLILNGTAGTAANLPWNITANYFFDSSGAPTYQLTYSYTLPESIVVIRSNQSMETPPSFILNHSEAGWFGGQRW